MAAYAQASKGGLIRPAAFCTVAHYLVEVRTSPASGWSAGNGYLCIIVGNSITVGQALGHGRSHIDHTWTYHCGLCYRFTLAIHYFYLHLEASGRAIRSQAIGYAYWELYRRFGSGRGQS